MKMKGIFKSITRIFVVKEEREMEIGLPTDVKHVAHIGLDGLSGGAPSWMNEFKTAADNCSDVSDQRESSATAVTARTTWSSQDFDQSAGQNPALGLKRDMSQAERLKIAKKTKRKKNRTTSSPKSLSSSSTSSRTGKSKLTYSEMEARPLTGLVE